MTLNNSSGVSLTPRKLNQLVKSYLYRKKLAETLESLQLELLLNRPLAIRVLLFKLSANELFIRKLQFKSLKGKITTPPAADEPAIGGTVLRRLLSRLVMLKHNATKKASHASVPPAAGRWASARGGSTTSWSTPKRAARSKSPSSSSRSIRSDQIPLRLCSRVVTPACCRLGEERRPTYSDRKNCISLQGRPPWRINPPEHAVRDN